MIKRLLISGYKGHELGIFKTDHPGVDFIKLAIQKNLRRLLEEEELEWVIISGQLGVELWAAEVTFDLQLEFPNLKLACITPFLDQEKKWKDETKEYYEFILSQADFVDSITKKPFEGAWQFRAKNKFLIENTDGVLLVYDEDKPSNAKYLKEACLKYSEKKQYEVLLITLYDLQSIAEEEQLKQSEW